MEEEIKIEEIKESKLKKFFIIIIGAFLILLIVSYLIISYPTFNIIRGQLESYPIKDNKILVENITIILDKNVFDNLQEIYFDEQKVEFSVCLLGQKNENEYYINYLYKPITYDQKFDSVRFEPCSENTLIMLHSHPYKSCLASGTDLENLEKNKKINKNLLMVVMCQPDRFAVYS